MSADPDFADFELVPRGHLYDDFTPGRRFEHHWGRTITPGDNAVFSTATCSWVPLYLDAAYARAHGHPDLVVNPWLVLSTVVGLSVEDLSEYGGGPFLGLGDCEFRAPVYPGDTLTAASVVTAQVPSNSRPGWGIVTWRTTGTNQHGAVVVEFTRSNLVSMTGGARV